MQSDFEQLLNHSQLLSYQAGHYLIIQAAELENLFYIVSGVCVGSLVTSNGNEYTFNTIPEGQGIHSVAGLGMIFLHTPTASFNVLALTDIVCYKIPRSTMHQYLLEHPEELMNFTGKLMSLYTDLCLRLNSRNTSHTIEQYCRFILENSRVDNGIRFFDKKYSNAEIAQYIGVHPVTLSRMTSALIENHCLEKTSKGYKIIDVALLTNIANGYATIQYREKAKKKQSPLQ